MVQGLDYYDVLGLTRNADDLVVRRAYRRLALKFHPEISKEPSDAAEFIRICEAYDVLSEASRKGLFDLYGEDGLKDGITDASGNMKGGTYHFDPETTPPTVFERFFGTANPYEALDSIGQQFEAMAANEPQKQGKNKVYSVELSLEEIFHGCLKRVTHKRKVLLENSEYIEESRSLTIDVKPGLPSGTRFVFESEGNKTPSKAPGPVIFVLKPLPHDRFVRRGADLVHKVTLPLYQALCGTSIEVPTLDSRTLAVPISDIVKPGHRTVVAGEGMPIPGGAGRGNLIVEVELLFPQGLTEAQKGLVKAGFFLPQQPSEKQAHALLHFDKAFRHPLEGWSTGIPKGDAAQ
ncbi:hypothetical protein FOA52_015517 [Chlamydomonas sp. UWO 241]|nr:hypothetical protein FOA52_015517 [Chlamydomonas sp. UWO 241]